MTAHFDLQDSTTSARVAPDPTGRQRPRRWLVLAGLVAAAVTTIGGVAAMHNHTSVERVPPTPAVAGTDATTVVARPAVESAVIRAERLWAGDEFDLAPVDRASARPAVESAVIRAERLWAGDEFDLAPVDRASARPAVESAVIRAERLWAGDEFDLAPVDRASARPAVESAVIRAERLWAGDEFDLAPAEDVCLMHVPC